MNGRRRPYVGHLEVNGTVRVEDVVEQVAIVIVTGKLGLQGSLELERGGGGLQLGVDVLRATHGGDAVQVLHAVVLHLLAVVVGQGLLLEVRVVGGSAAGLAVGVLGSAVAQTHGAGRLREGRVVVSVVGVAGVVVVGRALPAAV
ncbi:hypothetical protein BS50DRAFT_241359 [Corynespora cassiicola Philippines]|uniref:Uncharacterized protein n=1 Tax=Corynespora cassiicola Philippines TaxID=1448308 RepID=A0A2T2P2X0_CORCC|nr:hypothetical protein BS50DRAFT_241359 [Corynespora cassiicola Philippines]